ncbi:hypothetical protein VCUG_01744 [Vavraia culicis subsp. floridensis]|uniref:Uncharacterized protein n=1 Tax=Vavraia culicis (isolate floridensis) TaxID=948595 RepID=L2GUK6_VAVCU|nr:uncharacterized protein VCUG_01744 [Vavraia culicis subsp. floridensis]ELA46785.1 hypothetical protein VCUG_01744 [Vavraia culicis subsp. floridensis]
MYMYDKDAQKFEKYLNKYGTNLRRIYKTKRYRKYTLEKVMLQYLSTISAGIPSTSDSVRYSDECKVIKIYDVDKASKALSWCVTTNWEGKYVNYNRKRYLWSSTDKINLLLRDYFYYLKGQLKMVKDGLRLAGIEPMVFSDESDASEQQAENCSSVDGSDVANTSSAVYRDLTANTGDFKDLEPSSPAHASAAPSSSAHASAAPSSSAHASATPSSPAHASAAPSSSHAANLLHTADVPPNEENSISNPLKTPNDAPATNTSVSDQGAATVVAKAKSGAIGTTSTKKKENTKKTDAADVENEDTPKPVEGPGKPSVVTEHKAGNQPKKSMPSRKQESEKGSTKKNSNEKIRKSQKHERAQTKELEIASMLRMSRENGSGKN